MVTLKGLYEKDIDREIQGVIKVDDENFISQELEEYVVTEELLKHFKEFFSAYNVGINGNTEKMGVWISGFFGSGKSHFLKIISYLLENRVVKGKKAVDYFTDKIEDEELFKNMKTAGEISTDVILFNIESKTGRNNGAKDTILEVFEKVLNEKMGLSNTPFVAEIERFLISENKYEEFKQVFKEVSGKEWERKRDFIQIATDEFAKTYVKVMNKSIEEARGVIDKTEKNYKLSVEKFAKRVREYIESKGNNHHIVFLIDEIGAYIGDNTDLMLNLQTIVEELGLECGGKAWIILTSQEAIDDVIKVKGNDFSKIQGRFDTKLSLSSKDISEIIDKRILSKNSEAKESLEIVYKQEEAIIRNLVSFKDAAYQKKYENVEDFTKTYPFIPYQFKLLQDVFTVIRKHGYAGKEISSGERSLLGAIQETAKHYANNEVGTLIPFYAFYDTIEKSLDYQVKNVIKTAMDTVKGGELKDIDVNVLKMLFMLRNIKEIPANADNLTTLYISNIRDDKIAIKKEIEESLRRLEVQTLIQRNNEEYRFLTDEEQEINREIKRIVIDQNRITDYLKKIIFDYILIDKKVVYRNKTFPIAQYVDNIKYSQEYELGVKVLATALEKDDAQIIMQSSRECKYVFVKLEISTLIYDEITNYLQVEEYRRSNSMALQTKQVEDIIRGKQREIENAEIRVKENIREQLNCAEIIIAGDRQNILSKEARTRVNDALEILISNIYTKFGYIAYNYSVQDIKDLFYKTKQELDFKNEKAYDAVKEYCEEKNADSITMTIRTILQYFNSAPYGFCDEDILYILTKLLKDEVISLIYNNETQNITSEDTLNKLLRKEYYDHTVVKIRQRISIDLINNLKSVARTAFNVMNLREDEDGMVEDFKNDCLRFNIQKLNNIMTNYGLVEKYQYPGKQEVQDALRLFEELLRVRDVADFFSEVQNRKEEIIEIAAKLEDIIDFFKENQRVQFDEARKIILIYDNNKDYTDINDELTKTVKRIKEILTSNEPYGEIFELPMLSKTLRELLTNMYDVKSAPIIEDINSVIEYIEKEVVNVGVDEEFGKRYVDICKSIINTLEHSNELKDIFAQQTRIEQLRYNFIRELEIEKNKLNNTDDEPVVQRRILRMDRIIERSYKIDSREDVDRYVEEIRKRLIGELDDNDGGGITIVLG